MKRTGAWPIPLLILAWSVTSRAALPAPPQDLAPWAMPWGNDVPGIVSADSLIPKPAGKDGPIVARDGHFYEQNQRVRFWGFSIAFSGNFPTHEEADQVARRLARFGINAVRIHHIDMFPYPNGIFADNKLEALSPEALDRLDYFVAALKSQGIYTDLNLHVSRWWSKAHHWPGADKLPEFDKMVDLFEPRLIDAQKQYARDLLTHVNAYTHARYADEPAVCFLEINNENTLFLWGGEQKLAQLPEPYSNQLTGLWNQWLGKKYGDRSKLRAAWARGADPLGSDMIPEPYATPRSWSVEQHDSAKMSASAVAGDEPGIQLKIESIDSTSWHLQYSHGGIKLQKGKYYTVILDGAESDHPRPLEVSVGQAHAPWGNLGLATSCELSPSAQRFRFGFVANDDDDNARISLAVGQVAGTITLRRVELREGGRQGLGDTESLADESIARGYPDQGYTQARRADWYDFLKQTDQAYFVEMRRYLKDDLGVKCPITGTIGLGALGTESQSHMDFVDAHAYWDHPQFPHRPWDSSDWTEKNEPMVDNPAGATLWGLAATRVAGKPFTVTEYNHAAPNEWQAECVAMIATYAALQDWDGVFLFDYVGSNHYRELDHTKSYFDFEGNPQKMDLMPMGARIFLGQQVRPLAGERIDFAPREQMLDTGSQYYYAIWPFTRDLLRVSWQEALSCRLALTFEKPPPAALFMPDPRIAWNGNGANGGTGRFELRDPNAAVFVGFAAGRMPIDLGAARIEKLQTPFATIIVAPQAGSEPIDRAGRLLVSAVARGGNTGMEWDAARHTVSNRWGNAPPTIEVVRATLSIRSDVPISAFALTADGKRGESIPVKMGNGRATFEIGTANTLWYELERTQH